MAENDLEMHPLKEKKAISEERKLEIAERFQKNCGILSEENIAELNALPIREIFSLLSNQKNAALIYLHKFPREETIDLLMELSKQQEFSTDSRQETISFILGKFLHHPETFAKTIKIFKKKNDPRVIQETEKGRIEMADDESVVDEMCEIDPALEKNREGFKEYARKGEVFTYRDKDQKIVCSAVANQMENYILYISYIFTVDEKRRQGFGEDLLRYLVDQHEILQTDLIREDMLSENVLNKIGFKKDEHMNRWIHQKQISV